MRIFILTAYTTHILTIVEIVTAEVVVTADKIGAHATPADSTSITTPSRAAPSPTVSQTQDSASMGQRNLEGLNPFDDDSDNDAAGNFEDDQSWSGSISANRSLTENAPANTQVDGGKGYESQSDIMSDEDLSQARERENGRIDKYAKIDAQSDNVQPMSTSSGIQQAATADQPSNTPASTESASSGAAADDHQIAAVDPEIWAISKAQVTAMSGSEKGVCMMPNTLNEIAAATAAFSADTPKSGTLPVTSPLGSVPGHGQSICTLSAQDAHTLPPTPPAPLRFLHKSTPHTPNNNRTQLSDAPPPLFPALPQLLPTTATNTTNSNGAQTANALSPTPHLVRDAIQPVITSTAFSAATEEDTPTQASSVISSKVAQERLIFKI